MTNGPMFAAVAGGCKSMRAPLTLLLLFAIISAFLLPHPALAQVDVFCGEFTGRGLDYTNAQQRARHLSIVERFHFTDDVRALRRGVNAYLAQDLEYVLNSFPNHHGALDAMVRLALREGTTQPRHARADIECRFEWAIRTQPRDAMVRAIRANYYYRVGRHNDAREQLRIAATLAPDHPEIHYNLGLTLYRLGDYENARLHAAEAYSRGYPLPGLRDMLARAGYPLDD